MTQWALQFIHCQTPLHNGAGQGLGVIDRPIIREAATDYPFIQSSTLKGAYRAAAEANREPEKLIRAAFGHGEDFGNRGCVVFSDAGLLAFPVRSLAGNYALVTSALALARIVRRLEAVGAGGDPLAETIGAVLAHSSRMPNDATVALGSSNNDETDTDSWDETISLNPGGHYCLEGLILKPPAAAADAARKAMAELAWQLAEKLFAGSPESADYWKKSFRERLLLVSDDAFGHLIRTATQVEANIKIGKNGVTETGSLRYSEYLPAETVLVAFHAVEKPRIGGVSHAEVTELCQKLGNGPIQFGADESKGKGIVCSSFYALGGSSAAGEGGAHA